MERQEMLTRIREMEREYYGYIPDRHKPKTGKRENKKNRSPMFYDYHCYIQRFSGGYAYFVQFRFEAPNGVLQEFAGVESSLDDALGKVKTLRAGAGTAKVQI